MQRDTDLQFVGELARRNGLEFFFETERGAARSAPTCAPPASAAIRSPIWPSSSARRATSSPSTPASPVSARSPSNDADRRQVEERQHRHGGDTQLDKLGKRVLNDLVGGPLDRRWPRTAPRYRPADQQRHRAQAIVQAVRDEAVVHRGDGGDQRPRLRRSAAPGAHGPGQGGRQAAQRHLLRDQREPSPRRATATTRSASPRAATRATLAAAAVRRATALACRYQGSRGGL